MTTQINGDTGVSQVQPGAIDAADFQAALFAASLTPNGYQKLPSGLIIQWGISGTVVAQETITFPIPFPNAFLQAVVTPKVTAQATDILFSCSVFTTTLSTMIIVKRFIQGATGVAVSGIGTSWIAIGF